jgi:hypothetical protein
MTLSFVTSGTVPALTRVNEGKDKTLRIVGVLAENLNKHLQNKNQKHYCFSQLTLL